MPNLVTDIEIDEISLVDEGANEGARVVIVKARDSEAPTMNLHQLNDALEAAGDKLAGLEGYVEEMEVEVAKLRLESVAQDAEIERLKNTNPEALLN